MSICKLVAFARTGFSVTVDLSSCLFVFVFVLLVCSCCVVFCHTCCVVFCHTYCVVFYHTCCVFFATLVVWFFATVVWFFATLVVWFFATPVCFFATLLCGFICCISPSLKCFVMVDHVNSFLQSVPLFLLVPACSCLLLCLEEWLLFCVTFCTC